MLAARGPRTDVGTRRRFAMAMAVAFTLLVTGCGGSAPTTASEAVRAPAVVGKSTTTSKRVRVPNVVGTTTRAARAMLEEGGLRGHGFHGIRPAPQGSRDASAAHGWERGRQGEQGLPDRVARPRTSGADLGPHGRGSPTDGLHRHRKPEGRSTPVRTPFLGCRQDAERPVPEGPRGSRPDVERRSQRAGHGTSQRKIHARADRGRHSRPANDPGVVSHRRTDRFIPSAPAARPHRPR